MPVDRTYPAFRYAMWEAHGEACCYCRRRVEFVDMQIDHVVPEAVINEPTAWAKMAQDLNLNVTFDPQGLDNLVAACGPCNRQKTGTAFDAIQALLPLRKAASLKPVIVRRVKSLERQAQETELEVLIDLRRMFAVRRAAKN